MLDDGLFFLLLVVGPALLAAGPLVAAVRRHDQRRLVLGLAWSWRTALVVAGAVAGVAVFGFHGVPTIVAAVLVAGGGVMADVGRRLRRFENEALAAFADRREMAFTRAPAFRTPFWAPPRPDGTPAPHVDELVAGVRRLARGSMEVPAMAEGVVDGRTVLVANVATDDTWWSVAWTDVRLPGGEIVVRQPSALRKPVFRAERQRVDLPHLVDEGREVSASVGLSDAEIDGVLAPAGLRYRERPETIALRLGKEGLVVARPRAVAEELGLDELLGLALDLARAADRRREQADLFR